MTTINTMSAAKQVAASVDGTDGRREESISRGADSTLTTDIQASAEKETQSQAHRRPQSRPHQGRKRYQHSK